MKKIVLRVDIHDGKGKQKAMKVVATLQGIDSIAVDLNERKMTVIGIVDPIHVVEKLRKCWPTTILSVGPKDEPKKDGKEEPKKEEPKKEDEEKKKKDTQKMVEGLVEAYKAYNPFMTTHYFVQSAEENPNACAIL